jgi:hypothetical protein
MEVNVKNPVGVALVDSLSESVNIVGTTLVPNPTHTKDSFGGVLTPEQSGSRGRRQSLGSCSSASRAKGMLWWSQCDTC